MKIYYIASFTKIWDEECIAQALENLGHEVIRREQKHPNSFFLKEIEKHKPDFVFFAKLLIPENGFELLRKIKEMGVKTVSWTFDLYIGYAREYQLRTQAFWRADYVFTTDGGHQKEFGELGINHYVLRQGIYEPHAVIGKKRGEFMKDIVFVGTENRHYPKRQQLMERLSREFDFLWVGRYCPDTVRGLKLNDVYASAKIVIGDSVPSPNYWSNRIYETLGRGGFLLFPETRGLEKEYEIGKHLVTFKNYDDLKRKIKYYLENDLERTKIQLAGFDFTRTNYTYEKRCQKIIEIVGGGTKE
jgi:glycosyltransferase involved in cell wall biosynthesis